MGTSSVFIMLLVGPIRCYSAVIYVSAAMGLFSFTSGCVELRVSVFSIAYFHFPILRKWRKGSFPGMFMIRKGQVWCENWHC